jgi:hypothetical protein
MSRSYEQSKRKNFVREDEFVIFDKNNKPKKLTGYRIKNDRNGNPRYVFHFLGLDLPINYENKVKGSPFKRYLGKWFGGGLVTQMYNDEKQLQNKYDHLHGINKKRKHTVRDKRRYYHNRMYDQSLTERQRSYAKTQFHKLS